MLTIKATNFKRPGKWQAGKTSAAMTRQTEQAYALKATLMLDDLPQVDIAPHVAAIQATSVSEYYRRVMDVAWQMSRVIVDGEEHYPDCELVGLGWAVIRLGDRSFLTAFDVGEDGAISFAGVETWREVAREWVIKAAMTLRAEGPAMGSGAVVELKAASADAPEAFRYGGYTLIYGSAKSHDLYRDYFTPETDYWLGQWKQMPTLYQHRLDDQLVAKVPVGLLDTFEQDGVGIYVEGEIKSAEEIAQWAQVQLDTAQAYRDAVMGLIRKGVLAFSSDSAPHLVDRVPQANKTAWVKTWPFFANSFTPTPAEPRLAPVAEIKAAYQQAGLPIPKQLTLTPDAQPSRQAMAGKASQSAPTAQTISSAANGAGGKPMFKTLQEILDAAEQAALDGNLDEAKALQARAESLKSIQDMRAASAPPAPKGVKEGGAPVRPPFGDGDGDGDGDEPAGNGNGKPNTANPAVKAWYVKRFGEIGDATEQLAAELYQDDYAHLAWKKSADFRRFLRTGQYDPALSKLVLLTPDQIMDGVGGGFSVSEIRATMVEAVDTLGGYLVPEDWRNTLIERLPGLTVVRARANVMNTNRDVLTMTKVTGGNSRYKGAARVKWVDETPAAGASETNATFGPVNIPVHTVMATITPSRNLLEDSATNLDSYLLSELSVASAIDEDEKFLTAVGAGTPAGVLPGAGAPTDADITVVNSGNASALTADGVVKVPFGLPAQYRQAGGTWVFNKATAQTIALLKDSQNRYLWASNNDQLSAERPNRLLGYEVAESEAMPNIGANTFPIIFADWKGYTIADRIGMSLERYLDSATAETNTVKFIMRRRLGGQPLEGWRFVVQKVAA